MRHLFRPVFRAQPESTVNPSPPAFTHGGQYYSGVDRGASATLLEVQAGKEVEGIDFRLAARPTVALQGRVLLPQGVIPSREVSVSILDEPDSAQGVSMSTSASAPNFMFRLDNCAPGSYLVVAQTLAEGRQYRGVQRVELGADSPEVTIPLERGIDLAAASQSKARARGSIPTRTSRSCPATVFRGAVCRCAPQSIKTARSE